WLTCVDAGEDVPRGDIRAIDLVCRDSAFEVADGSAQDGDDLSCSVQPEVKLQRWEVLADLRTDLTAIATARPRPYYVSFEHGDGQPLSPKRQRRRQTGEARTDDCNVDREISLERGKRAHNVIHPEADGREGRHDRLGPTGGCAACRTRARSASRRMRYRSGPATPTASMTSKYGTYEKERPFASPIIQTMKSPSAIERSMKSKRVTAFVPTIS